MQFMHCQQSVSTDILKNILFTIILLALLPRFAVNAENSTYDVYSGTGKGSFALPDTILPRVVRDTTALRPKPTLIDRIVDYISSANDPRPAKKFDFSLLGGPYYTSDTKLGIGIVAAGIYRRSLTDSVPAGQFSIYGDISLTKYFKIGVDGTQYFNGKKYRLDYDVFFASRPDKFWGIGYDMARHDSNETGYKRWKSALDASFLISAFTPDFYVGPRINIVYVDGKNITRPRLWNGQKHRTFTDGIGLAMVYDSRDNEFCAFKGIYGRLDLMFAPKFLGNQYAFTLAEGTLCHYFEAWRGAVIASRLHARFTWGNTPWGLMSQLGGSSNMRGYWEGRYNDKCAADFTIELRQHLFSRIGAVVWGGVGEVFPAVANMFCGHALWNCGIGVRWEFKHRVNVRVDYGFGQNQNGLVFSINEAF